MRKIGIGNKMVYKKCALCGLRITKKPMYVDGKYYHERCLVCPQPKYKRKE